MPPGAARSEHRFFMLREHHLCRLRIGKRERESGTFPSCSVHRASGATTCIGHRTATPQERRLFLPRAVCVCGSIGGSVSCGSSGSVIGFVSRPSSLFWQTHDRAHTHTRFIYPGHSNTRTPFETTAAAAMLARANVVCPLILVFT